MKITRPALIIFGAAWALSSGYSQQPATEAPTKAQQILRQKIAELNSAESLPSVWVPEADVDRARPVVEEYRRTDEANAADDAERPRATWTCPNCGEKVEEQFTQCWKCGHNRPLPGGDVIA